MTSMTVRTIDTFTIYLLMKYCRILMKYNAYFKKIIFSLVTKNSFEWGIFYSTVASNGRNYFPAKI